MVKFGKQKFKLLNKLVRKQNDSFTSNKVIKKRINAEKKVTFHKEVLLKQAIKSHGLVKSIKTTQGLQSQSKKSVNQKPTQNDEEKKVKLKPVEKHKKRQKTQISDTKLLLSLMKNK